MFVAILLAGWTASAQSQPQPAAAAPPSLVAVTATQDATVTFYEARGWRLRLLKAIPAGKSPTEMCLAPDKSRLYVSDAPNHSVLAIDLKQQAVVATLTNAAMKSPDGCVVSPDSKKLYSIDQQANAVFVFAAENNALVKQIPVGEEPRRGLFSTDGKRLIVTNAHSDSLSVINPANDTVVNTVKTPGHEPRWMAWSPDGKFLAVTIIEDDSVDFFKADTLEFDQQVAAAVSSQRALFANDGKLLYVLGRFEHLHVIDMRTDGPPPGYRRQITTLPAPRLAWGMAATPDTGFLFITQTGSPDAQIAVIDTRVLKTVNSITGPKGLRDIIYIP
jgi:YVTN family beta-propeller protein